MMMMMKIIIDPSSRQRRHPLYLICCLLILMLLPSSVVSANEGHGSIDGDDDGFSIEEELFLRIPNATLAKSSLYFLTRLPHVAGTEGDALMADYVQNEFLNAGLPIVTIDKLLVKLNYPNFDFENNDINTPTSSLSLWEITNNVDNEEDEEDDGDEDEDEYEDYEDEDYEDYEDEDDEDEDNMEVVDENDEELTEDTIIIGEKKVLRRSRSHRKKKKKKKKKKKLPLDGSTSNTEKRTLLYQAKLSEDIILDNDNESGDDDDEYSSSNTDDTIWRNHSFHGYSPSGNLYNKKFIYANYGRPQDFQVLQSLNITITDKIVIVRYGKCFRGLKVYNTQLHGGVGVIIYSDPYDDGYNKGTVYPNGPWRSASSIQRGSVQFISHCGGDPYRIDPRYQTLLGLGRNNSNANVSVVEQLCGVNTSDIIPNIPSIPLSYEDVIPLLQNLGGLSIKEIPLAIQNNFEGGITNVTYKIGPSKGYLDLMIDNKDAIVNISNVIGIIPGIHYNDNNNNSNNHQTATTLEELEESENLENLDQPILLGNHRDAWIYGASDPNSGTSALLEVAKGLGYLYKYHNWKPLRSIYFCSWSGEEYGLLGSTGWSELNIRNMNMESSSNSMHSNNTSSSNTKLQLLSGLQRSLAYLNTDTIVSGDQLKVSSSPSLVTLWNSVINDLKYEKEIYENDNENEIRSNSSSTTSSFSSRDEQVISSKNARFLKNVTIRDANTDWEIIGSDDNTNNDNNKQQNQNNNNNNNIGILGSGSDYTVFLDHFGIPSLDFSYTKKNSGGTYGVYHSIYDSFDWMNKYGGCTSTSTSSVDSDSDTMNSDENENKDDNCNAFEIIEFASKIWGLLAMRLATFPVVPIDHVIQGNSLDGYISYLKQELNMSTSNTSTSSTSTSSGRVVGISSNSDHDHYKNNRDIDLHNLTDAVMNYKKNAAKLQLHCYDISKKRSMLLSSSSYSSLPSSSSLSSSNQVNNNSSNDTNTNKNKNNNSKIITNSNDNDNADDYIITLLSNQIDACNEKLGLTERFFLLKDGLPGRPWFKHCLQAPGIDLGYAAEAFPGIQQAINNRKKDDNYKIVQEQINLTSERVQLAATNLEI